MEAAVKLLDKLAEIFGFSIARLRGSCEDDLHLSFSIPTEGIECSLGISWLGSYGKVFASSYEDAVEAVCEILKDNEERKLGVIDINGNCINASKEEEKKLAKWIVEANLGGFGLDASQ